MFAENTKNDSVRRVGGSERVICSNTKQPITQPDRGKTKLLHAGCGGGGVS